MASILDYLQGYEKTKLINVKVPVSLYADVIKQFEIDRKKGKKINMTKLFHAAMLQYLDENEVGKTSENFEALKASNRS